MRVAGARFSEAGTRSDAMGPGGGHVDLTAEQGLHFLALLFMTAGIVTILVLALRCAWCGWRDRWEVRHRPH